MDRIIKFRVWDNVDYMSTPFTLQELQLSKVQFGSDCPVMQYTGLKDKNGREIYEGDIVSVDERKITGFGIAHAFTGYVKYSEKRGAYQIMVNHGDKERWEYLAIGSMYGDEHGIQLQSIEIIGNIFENHELISK